MAEMAGMDASLQDLLFQTGALVVVFFGVSKHLRELRVAPLRREEELQAQQLLETQRQGNQQGVEWDAGQNEGHMSWVIFLGFGFIPKCFMIHAFCFGRLSIFDFESC